MNNRLMKLLEALHILIRQSKMEDEYRRLQGLKLVKEAMSIVSEDDKALKGSKEK